MLSTLSISYTHNSYVVRHRAGLDHMYELLFEASDGGPPWKRALEELDRPSCRNTYRCSEHDEVLEASMMTSCSCAASSLKGLGS